MPQDNDRTVTLHIGRHKTGTSSIQATLAAHRDLLRSRGVLYPSSLPENLSGFFVKAFHPAPEKPPHNREGLTRTTIRKSAERQIAAFKEELATTNFEKVVLSGENACVLPLEGIRDLKRFVDELIAPTRYETLFYVRHPISRALSGIQQNVKGNGMTLEDAKASHVSGDGKPNSAIIQDYSSVFGADAVTVRSFDAALAESGDMVTDFCTTAGIDPTGITPIRENDSIAAEIVYFLSWLYEGPRRSGEERLVNRKTRVPVSDEERKLLYGLKGAKADFLTAEDIVALWTVVEDDMAFIEEHYGIAYRKPEAKPPSESRLFTKDFLEGLDTAMPSFSPALQEEVTRSLQTHNI